MTEFNPYFRQSANEMLHAPVFAPVKGRSDAFLSKEKIQLAVDMDDAFDYETGLNLKFSKNEILEMILKEAKKTHKSRISHLKKAKQNKQGL